MTFVIASAAGCLHPGRRTAPVVRHGRAADRRRGSSHGAPPARLPRIHHDPPTCHAGIAVRILRSFPAGCRPQPEVRRLGARGPGPLQHLALLRRRRHRLLLRLRDLGQFAFWQAVFAAAGGYSSAWMTRGRRSASIPSGRVRVRRPGVGGVGDRAAFLMRRRPASISRSPPWDSAPSCSRSWRSGPSSRARSGATSGIRPMSIFGTELDTGTGSPGCSSSRSPSRCSQASSSVDRRCNARPWATATSPWSRRRLACLCCA